MADLSVKSKLIGKVGTGLLIILALVICADIVTTMISINTFYQIGEASVPAFKEINSNVLIQYGPGIWITVFLVFIVVLYVADQYVFRKHFNFMYFLLICVPAPLIIEFNAVIGNIIGFVNVIT